MFPIRERESALAWGKTAVLKMAQMTMIIIEFLMPMKMMIIVMLTLSSNQEHISS